MGTAESILSYNDDGDHGPAALASASSRGLPPQGRSSRRPSSSSSTGGLPRGSHSQHRTSNRRPGVALVRRLSGLVLGMSQSGKQTLLQRLEGRDPFRDDGGGLGDDHSERISAVVPYRPPPEAGGDARDDAQVQLAVRVARTIHSPSATSTAAATPVDFAVLLLNPTHDPRRIRQYLRDVVFQLLQLQGYRGAASSVIDDAAAGAGRAAEEGAAGQGPPSEEAEASPPPQQGPGRPVCLCLLINFRDLKPPSKRPKHRRSSSSSSSSSSAAATSARSSSASPSTSAQSRGWLRRSTVRRWVLEDLADYGTEVEPSMLVLQCGHSSLYDCFGLDLLHHFVYQSYLHAQRREAQIRLQALQGRVHRAAILPESVMTSYSDFLKANASPVPAEPRTMRRQSSSSTRPVSEARQQARRQVLPTSRHEPVSASAGTTPSSSPPPSGGTTPRRISEPAAAGSDANAAAGPSAVRAASTRTTGLPASTRVRNPPGAGAATARGALSPEESRAALEAFLKDDSDSADDGPGHRRLPVHPRALGRRPQYQPLRPNADDDDDDDDDFIVDHVGHRQSASVPPRPSSALTSKSDETPNSPAPIHSPSPPSSEAPPITESEDGAALPPSVSPVPSPTERTAPSPQPAAESLAMQTGEAESTPAVTSENGDDGVPAHTSPPPYIEEVQTEEPSTVTPPCQAKDRVHGGSEASNSDPNDVTRAASTSSSNGSSGPSTTSTPLSPRTGALAVLVSTTGGSALDGSEGDPSSSPVAAVVPVSANRSATATGEDDDDEFFIGTGSHPRIVPAASTSRVPPSPEGSPPPPSSSNGISGTGGSAPSVKDGSAAAVAAAAAGGSGGLSAAALAAIAAAQQEAERMLAVDRPRPDDESQGRTEKKPKKVRKKDGESKRGKGSKKPSKRRDKNEEA